jgi:DUF1009 family protein
MLESPPSTLAIIAGKGMYPKLLAASARQQGVKRVCAVAFRGETDPAIEQVVDEVAWIHLGQYGGMLAAIENTGAGHAVMAGQITPTHLFHLRVDARMLELLKRLKTRNAETIFGAVADDLKAIGIDLMPASTFMLAHMPEAGVLSERGPTEVEQQDIELGLKVAGVTSGLDIGQTVVVKEGTILAVEAFEGTDETIRRAGKLGGPGSVVVKLAKEGHDMRFDIPVVGLQTMKLLKRIKANALAVRARRAILLEREEIVKAANEMGLCLVAVEGECGMDDG